MFLSFQSSARYEDSRGKRKVLRAMETPHVATAGVSKRLRTLQGGFRVPKQGGSLDFGPRTGWSHGWESKLVWRTNQFCLKTMKWARKGVRTPHCPPPPDAASHAVAPRQVSATFDFKDQSERGCRGGSVG